METEPASFTPAFSPRMQEQNMVGNSAVMQHVANVIHKIAKVDAPVMINGESGTGKELAARKIHLNSNRKNQPFITVNCATLPENLIYSELFGHEKGTFPDARQRKTGRIEAANGGTLFLSELSSLTHQLQGCLLRLLRDGSIERVGGSETLHLDIRIISATQSDLKNTRRENTLREDLFYRLNVLQLSLPPLRERDGDTLDIAELYLHRFAKEQGAHVKGFTEDAKRLINVYGWPGNIREVINLVRRAVATAEHELINPTDLTLERREESRNHLLTLSEVRAEAETGAILASLRRNRHNVAAAARQLGISRVTLYRLMEKNGITKE